MNAPAYITAHAFDADHFSDFLIRELRSDHAGEMGAVYIYRGALATARTAGSKAFAKEHLAVETRHLEFFEKWLPKSHHSKLIGIWKLAGFTLGAVSALFGERTLFVTIDAVEEFVVEHYQQQLDFLESTGNSKEKSLVQTLRQFQADEALHRKDASSRLEDTGYAASIWRRLVGEGSALAVSIARNI